MTYIGRFAPSPTGPLHFGSLVAALASYLDAKVNRGQWLVRMEDLDPPREQQGSSAQILQSLQDHCLYWDGDVLYQSQRYSAYEAALEQLRAVDVIYPCICTRRDLRDMGGIYDGRCRERINENKLPHSLRLKLYPLPPQPEKENVCFRDLIQGLQTQNLRTQMGDSILKRRDQFYAYQLAVVVDDIAQGITHIIRGADLLEVSGGQLVLFDLLGAARPQLGHLPIAIQANGQKLSKQNQAKPILASESSRNLWQCLRFLGQNPPSELLKTNCPEILDWGLTHWQREKISGLSHLYQD